MWEGDSSLPTLEGLVLILQEIVALQFSCDLASGGSIEDLYNICRGRGGG